MARFLAVDADANGLFVASAELRGGKVSLGQVVGRAGEERPLHTNNAVAYGEQLRTMLNEAGIKPAPVLLCVGRDRIILKDVQYPETPPAEEPAIVRFQAVKELSESPDDMVMDYVPLSREDGDLGKHALAVFIRRELRIAADQLCETAGLKLAAIAPRPFATVAALNHHLRYHDEAHYDAEARIGVVTVWSNGGEFTVGHGSEVPFTRNLSTWTLSNAKALAGELKRNLTVFSGQHPTTPVQSLHFVTSDPQIVEWLPELRAGLNVPVELFDPFAVSETPITVPPKLQSRFLGPIGMLAMRSESANLPINFVTPRQPKADVDPNRTKLLLAALLLIVLFGGIFLLGFLQLNQADQRIADLQAEVETADMAMLRFSSDLKRLDAAEEFKQREVVVLDELYDLSSRVPDVDAMTATELIMTQMAKPREKRRLAGAPEVKTKAVPTPASKMTLKLESTQDRLPQDIVDAFKNDQKFYPNATKTIGGSGSVTGGQSYTIISEIMPRPSDEYQRQLDVVPPRGETPDSILDDTGGIDP